MSKKNKIVLDEFEEVTAVVPENCSGPGWSNSPIWVHIENHALNKHRTEVIQPHNQTQEMQILFRTCAEAHKSMLCAVRRHTERKYNDPEEAS